MFIKINKEILKITGYILLSISSLLFILIPVVPFLHLSAGQIAGISTGLLIAGEILFYLSIFILGRSFYARLKNKFKFRRKSKSDPEVSVKDE